MPPLKVHCVNTPSSPHFCLARYLVQGRDIELGVAHGCVCVCVCQLRLLTKYLENRYAYNDVTWCEVAGGTPQLYQLFYAKYVN